MTLRLDQVLKETLFSLNIVSEYTYKVLYEWISLAVHQCQRGGFDFQLSPEVWERLVQRMIDQLAYKGWTIKANIERLLRQFMALSELPWAALGLTKEPIRNHLPEIYALSKVAGDFIINCWTEAVIDNPPLAAKMLTCRNIRLVFRILEEWYQFQLAAPESTMAKGANYAEMDRRQTCSFFQAVQFLNFASMSLEEDVRVDLFLAYEYEIAGFVKALPLLERHGNAMHEFVLLLCATVLVVDEAKPLSEERLVLERLLRFNDLQTLCDHVERYAPDAKREAFFLIMSHLAEYKERKEERGERD